VVDDDQNVASAMAMLLEVQGYDVAVGLSGAEALRLASDLRPRVVFLDIGMQGMDGFEAAQRLRQVEPDVDRMLLVAVSGYDDEAFLTACREAGFDHHLTKPVSRSSLSALLDRVV
jgi:two-component system CheB/CheR fusion protein